MHKACELWRSATSLCKIHTMDKAVRLGNPGEAPPWGMGGGRTPIDDDIEAAKDALPDEQRELFFRCARHLYDMQVSDRSDQKFDHSDNDQWLADLATWFGWSDEFRDEIKREAMRSAAEVLPHEMPAVETED